MGEHRWLGSVSLAAAVGVLYYLVAYLSLSGLFYYQSEGVTVFWAAAGISSGLLIGFGFLCTMADRCRRFCCGLSHPSRRARAGHLAGYESLPYAT